MSWYRGLLATLGTRSRRHLEPSNSARVWHDDDDDDDDGNDDDVDDEGDGKHLMI